MLANMEGMGFLTLLITQTVSQCLQMFTETWSV